MTYNIRQYIPLLGFVVPTVIVGYGIVIPQSCIAGVNELSIGFGTTILGAVFTYFAGQRAVMPKRACTKPLRVRIEQWINRQAASPSGWFGRVLALIWLREHARLNAEVIEHLELCERHDVLEVGFGPGEALAKAVRQVPGGRVVGIDISKVMVDVARRRNRRVLADGKLEVLACDITSFDLEGRTFDRIFAVHSIYFWSDVDVVLTKLARALRPGGKLLLAFQPESENIPQRFRDPTYRFPRTQELAAAIGRVGLHVDYLLPSGSAPNTVLLRASRAISYGTDEAYKSLTTSDRAGYDRHQ